MRLFARGGDHREGDFARSIPEIKRFVDTYDDHNVYVAPNPTSYLGGSRHSASDVTHWSYFLIDIDPVCHCPADRSEQKLPKCATCRGKAEPRRAMDMALSLLSTWSGYDLLRERPVIIDSGRGTQAWVRLEDVQLVESTTWDIRSLPDGGVGSNRALARKVNGYWLKKLDEELGLCHGCRIDTSVSDLPRVMRCPGSVNVKTGRMAHFVNATDRVYAGLAVVLLCGTPSTALEDPVSDVEVAPGQPWQMVTSHLTRMAQDYLKYGHEEPGRHKVMWHTAKKFQELGVSRQEARRALRWANALKGADQKLPLDQVEHALSTAYGA